MEIINKVRDYVEQFWNDNQNESLVYHNYEYTKGVVAAAEEIIANTEAEETDQEAALLAAWLHATGCTQNYENYLEESNKIAKAFLSKEDVATEKIDRVIETIAALKSPNQAESLAAQILCDAVLYPVAKNNFLEQAVKVRKEQELMTGTVKSNTEWLQGLVKSVIERNFQTPYGKEVLEKGKDKNLKSLKKEVKKLEADFDLGIEKALAVSPKELKELKKKLMKVQGRPERGIETMFRLTSRNHLALSSMADTKANIMISVNSIILSILIGSLMQKLDNNPQLIFPTYVMLFVNLGSIIFAILSTRPNITTGKFTREDIEQNKTNLLFFGNFHQMQRADYQWGMHRLMADGKFLYSSLIDDIFFLGVVLGRKYRYLRIAYNIFMYGIVLAVVTFMISNAMYRNG